MNMCLNGAFVRSKAGRDKGRIFVCVSHDGGEYLHIADGKLRKVVRPKLKKLKHVDVLDIPALESAAAMTNKQLISAVKECEKTYLTDKE